MFSSLATGGLIAALIGFWSQLKGFISYTSSFIVVHAKLDYHSSAAVRIYLKKHYKVVPNGKYFFQTEWLETKDRTFTYIPFRLLSSTTIFYKGAHILLVKQNSANDTKLHILALRWTIDYEDLVSKSLDYLVQLEAQDSATSSGFYIQEIIGSEKSLLGGLNGSLMGNTYSSPVSEAPSANGGLKDQSGADHLPLDIRIDRSFKYKPDVYLNAGGQSPFKYLYYDPLVNNYIKQAKLWKSMRSWYQDRGIPWRRGWLLHGPAGTGKSSLAKAVAIELSIPLYHFQLSTLSDQEFMREWDRMGTPAVVLFEDFDTIFDKRQPLTEHKLLTFDTVLNKISGVSSCNGLFLIVTTNHLDKIDEALGVACSLGDISTRPGRIDSLIYLGYLSTVNKEKMSTQILKDWPDLIEKVNSDKREMTPIQFQEYCIQEAFKRINETIEHTKMED